MSRDKTDDAAANVVSCCDRINLKMSTTDVAHDYTKRKHVMRLCCSSAADIGCTELLLQTDDASSMVRWLKALQEQALDVQPLSSLSAEEVSVFYTRVSSSCTPRSVCDNDYKGPGCPKLMRLSFEKYPKNLQKNTPFRY